MPLPINRVPPGLLSLLDTKSGGVNPLVLSDELNGSLELLPFYSIASGIQINGDSAASNAVGQLAPLAAGDNFRVPAGEIWVVQFVAIRSGAVLGAGTTVKCAPCIYNTSLGSVVWSDSQQEFLTGERVCVSTNRALVIGPNFGIGVHISGYVGLAQVFQFNALVSKLRL